MDAPYTKPSRIRRMREIDNLLREAKELSSELEQHRRDRMRLARKARKLANKVQRRPDMELLPHAASLHVQVDDLARIMYLSGDDEDEPINQARYQFKKLFELLGQLADAPWLKP